MKKFKPYIVELEENGIIKFKVYLMDYTIKENN